MYLFVSVSLSVSRCKCVHINDEGKKRRHFVSILWMGYNDTPNLTYSIMKIHRSIHGRCVVCVFIR